MKLLELCRRAITFPDIVITGARKDVDSGSIYVYAQASSRPSRCKNPKCNSVLLPHKHSSKHNLIQDRQIDGCNVYIDLEIYRYRCPECNHVFPDEFSFYDKLSHCTYRLREEFYLRCLNGQSFNSVATLYHVSHKTVGAAFYKYSKKDSPDF